VDIGYDNFEAIGKNRFGYSLYDTNCWMFRRDGIQAVANIYGRWGADRQLTEALHDKTLHIERYLVNYTAPKRLESFFKQNTLGAL
jgi:hypothetical protein